MVNRSPLEIKKEILINLLKENLTFAQLEKKINGNWKTIRSHCNELEVFGFISFKENKSHKLNNKPYTEISITKQGIDILKKIKK